jgi:hypothetical protein
MSAKQRFWFFVYSTPNIVGAAAALLGLAPHLLLELVSSRGGFNLWYVIVPGLYVLGYVASWSFQGPSANLKIRERQSAAEIRRELDDLVKQIRKQVAPEVLARVESIRNSTLDVLPQLTETSSSGNYDLYTVRQTALEYLPETLESYLNLPPTFARIHPLRDGKTAKQILLEQLTLIDDTLKEVVVNIHSQDANELLANQRFLNERLHKNEFAL